MNSISQPPDICVLYIARHGQTVLNAEGCFRGNKDVSLDDKGFRDAHALKKLFSQIPLSFVVCSDRLRARQTAEVIHEGKNIPIEKTPVLRALDVGDFSGQKRDEESEAKLQKYIDDPSLKIPGGESLKNFQGRIRPAIWEAFGMADDSGLPGLIVAHSSIVHEVSAMFAGHHRNVLVEPGGVVALYVKNGQIGVQAVYKPLIVSDINRAQTVS